MLRKYARIALIALSLTALPTAGTALAAERGPEAAPSQSPSPAPAPSASPGPSSGTNPSTSPGTNPGRTPGSPPGHDHSHGHRPSPSPSPTASPSPAKPAVKLTQTQFVDANKGWAVGTAGDDPLARVWRTTDGGSRWASSPIGEGVRNATIGMANADHGWAAGPSGCSESAGSAVCSKLNILHTHDGGKSWFVQWSKDDPKANADNQIEPVSEGTAYVRTRSAIWKTTDLGQNWTDVSIPGAEASPYRISFPDEATGYAAGRLGSACPEKGLVPASESADCQVAVWKTKDGGGSWKRLAHAPRKSGEWYPADVKFVDKNNGYLLLVNPDTHASILYATSNGGVGWKVRNTKIPGIRPYPVKLDFVDPRVGYVPLSVGAGPVDGGLLRTINGGTTFTKLQDPRLVSVEDADFLTARRGYIVAMNPQQPGSSLLLATNDGGDKWTDRTPPGP
ncbi:hypothetical protein H7B90_03790 [Cohnella xylanilytica]|uniref:Sortilin N-terminal domain-containing protein n=1 Tax=Cohnella xylanilytica TaxID=557555 RepID=A0A841TQA8_9BACL|nr:hypothetical protein [Cohnella xylanilytica]MBB6690517.1 hypothetical protein [Cohnella xylanilytica]